MELIHNTIQIRSQKRLDNAHNGENDNEKDNVTNPINCRREHQIKAVTRTKEITWITRTKKDVPTDSNQTKQKHQQTLGWYVISDL